MAKGSATMAEIDGVGNMATAGSDLCLKVVAAPMRRWQRGERGRAAEAQRARGITRAGCERLPLALLQLVINCLGGGGNYH